MRRFKQSLAITIVCTMMLLGQGNVFAETDPAASEKKVELTVQQKSELAALHKEILEKKKEVIKKYVQFGLMSEEKGQKIISHLEEHYAKKEKNGFIPQWDRHHKHGHKE
ncbi:YckD family protein [Ammoniphilus sp. 3BR4]|uniref:YckD family protein n=1 Tax=Ammoniphilus sp. 3BR4 TaxID=3158265 RepID=UPI0034650FFE